MARTYAVAACHRPDILKMNSTLDMLGFRKEHVVIVANGENPPTQEEIPSATVIQYPTLEYCMPNWWNMGLDYVQDIAGPVHNVFIFNADTYADYSTVTVLGTVLRDKDLAAVGPDRFNTLPRGFVLQNDRLEPEYNQAYRMTGYAFVLRGELGLRADPKFRHWYLDDDLEWQARANGGVGMVGGLTVGHPPAGNPLSPTLQQWAAEDREKFKVKWGNYPH